MDQGETGQMGPGLENIQVPQPPQQEYVATVPVEPVSENPGRVEGIIALFCASLSLLFFPLVFGITGITLAVAAHRKGASSLGTVGIVLSSLFMAVGIVLGVLVNISGEISEGVAEGAAWNIF